MDDMMTRRGFLAAGASCAALAALGASTGCSSSQPESSDSDDDLATYTTATLCAGCANACGIEAWVRDEELWRFMGAEGHPHSGGYLCGRGQGLPSLTTSEDRVLEPLKADGKGGFTNVSWDDALADIADHISGADGKTALFQDGRATDAWYAKRFMAAVGSPNYFDDSALVNADIDAAYT
ncbi:MAG: molybdopterin oxidoreductase, partial [Slackia sp.]|nr:molybdopterin oxidoreductase [Slackia sp.]